jgi:MFS family permease
LVGKDVTAPMLIGPMTLVGMGNGIAVPALIGSVLMGVEPKRAGAGAGVLTTSQQFASAAGIAVLGGVFFQVLGSRTGPAGYVDVLPLAGVAVVAGRVGRLRDQPAAAPSRPKACQLTRESEHTPRPSSPLTTVAVRLLVKNSVIIPASLGI